MRWRRRLSRVVCVWVLLYLPYRVFQKRTLTFCWLHTLPSYHGGYWSNDGIHLCLCTVQLSSAATFRRNRMPPLSKWSLCTPDVFSWSIQHPLESTVTLKKQAAYPSETWQYLTSTPYKNPNQEPRCQVLHAIFEILKPVNTKFTAFWDMTPWSLVDMNLKGRRNKLSPSSKLHELILLRYPTSWGS